MGGSGDGTGGRNRKTLPAAEGSQGVPLSRRRTCPDLAPCRLDAGRLSWLHRAGPSATLDKSSSVVRGIVRGGRGKCQRAGRRGSGEHGPVSGRPGNASTQAELQCIHARLPLNRRVSPTQFNACAEPRFRRGRPLIARPEESIERPMPTGVCSVGAPNRAGVDDRSASLETSPEWPPTKDCSAEGRAADPRHMDQDMQDMKTSHTYGCAPSGRVETGRATVFAVDPGPW